MRVGRSGLSAYGTHPHYDLKKGLIFISLDGVVDIQGERYCTGKRDSLPHFRSLEDNMHLWTWKLHSSDRK